ncbi:MAG: hypothetical protein CM15mP46_6890 [Alphaproteobacteria bacterium]|nr:MAG: hypothetical protein CM15mP46_6890 [Alphaproteobacteria bacterium]
MAVIFQACCINTLWFTAVVCKSRTASVSTYGERVVDVFYVKDIFGLQIHNEGRLQDIRQRLLQIFDSANEAAALNGACRWAEHFGKLAA